MNVIEKVTRTYQAVDGETFATEVECSAYEKSLPAHLRWCLTKGYPQEELTTVGLYVLGYTSTTRHTVYDPPAFLREGGEREIVDTATEVLTHVYGALTDVVAYAVENREWSRHGSRMIRKVPLVDLSTEALARTARTS